MSEKPRVRTVMGSQHSEASEKLLQSAWQYFSNIFWWLWKKISLKNSVLVVFEILRLFVNILRPNEKFSLSVKASV